MTTATMTRRMLGVETEYFFAAFLKSGQRGDPMKYLKKLIELAREIFGGVGGQGGCFLPNGSRLYIDCGHPELATCECTTPLEAVKYILAGDRILADLVEALKARCPEVEDAVLCRCHVDYSGSKATWGSHESYLHRTSPQSFQSYLLHHLASRVIYSGAGGLDSLSSQIEFQIEPRTPHLTSVVSGSSTNNRGLFHTKNETLSSGGYNRLHLLASATACSQTAMLLRLGTTCLLVALADLGKNPAGRIQLADPLQAMRMFSRDVSCNAQAPTTDGKWISAVEIQRSYLEEVTSELQKGNMPEWTADVCDTWEMVLDKLEKNPMDLVPILDWPLKLMLLSDHCERTGTPWAQRNRAPAAADRSKLRSQLCEIDVRFSEIGDRGIFDELDKDGHLHHRLVTEEDIESSKLEPPEVGRAKLRGKWVCQLSGIDGAQCDWQSVFDPRTRRRLDLSDPFQEHETWREMSPASQPAGTPRIQRTPRRATPTRTISRRVVNSGNTSRSRVRGCDGLSSASTETFAVVLGARRGGTHVMNTLVESGINIAGVYDQDVSAPGIANARRLGIPVYAGSWAELSELLTACMNNGAARFYVFLPTRDPKFIQFATRMLSRARARGFENFTVLKMDTDFSDYEPADVLCSLMGVNS